MSVANVYAKALLGAVSEKEAGKDLVAQYDQIETQLDAVLAAIDSSKEAQVALWSPVTNAKEKAAVVRELAAKMSLSPMIATFLVLLANKGRLSLLREVRNEFTAARLLAEGGVHGKLVSAEPIERADVDGLAKAFSKKLGKKVAFQVSTDPSLLAGMKVTVNGVTYDGTLRSQLQKLRDRFLVGLSG